MYREVVRCPQYAARKRSVLQVTRGKPRPGVQPHFAKHHHGKGALFKAQSRNSRSQPNLLNFSGCEGGGGALENGTRPEFQSQINIPLNPGAPAAVHHARTNSQPAYTEGGSQVYGRTGTGSEGGGNMLITSSGQNMQSSGNIYSDPIYSIPVKPFLSTQDVRHNGLPTATKPGATRPLNNHSQSVDVYGVISNRVTEDQSRVCRSGHPAQPLLYHRREASNPQIRRTNETNLGNKRCSVPQLTLYAGQSDVVVSNCQNGPMPDCSDTKSSVYGHVPNQGDVLQEMSASVKPFSSRGPVPPKPPRIITTLKRTAPTSGPETESGPPVKPPR